VGLLDVDICGPSIPRQTLFSVPQYACLLTHVGLCRMLGCEGHEVHQSASGWSPVYVEDNLGKHFSNSIRRRRLIITQA
jgi:hypothetical protein